MLLAASMAAEPSSAVRKLNSTLLSLKDGQPRDAVTLQLTTDLNAASDPDHRPMQLSISLLASQLANALPARDLRAERLSPLTSRIVDILNSAGTSTVGFYESVNHAEIALAALGVPKGKAHDIGQRLMTIGKQVRGPDDSPAK
jgi:hypothetical protein